MAKHKRVTFAFSQGWWAHKEGKPFDDKQPRDWQDGWIGRQVYVRNFTGKP